MALNIQTESCNGFADCQEFQVEITLLHIDLVAVSPVMIPEPTSLNPTGAPIATSAEVTRMVDATRDSGKKILSDGEQKIKAESVPVETSLREGNSSQEIVKAARKGSLTCSYRHKRHS